MTRKLLQIILVVLLCSLPNYSESNEISKVTVKEYIVKHSLELGIDPALALSIAKLESGFSHTKKSPYGAVGVFQVMPDTARRLGFNPYYVNDNIKGGLSYYKMLYKKFGSVELALAAYNAGPGNVARYNGMPPFKETKYFVSNIMTEYKTQKNNPDPVIHKVKKDVQLAKQQPKPVAKQQVAKPGVVPVSQQKTTQMTQNKPNPHPPKPVGVNALPTPRPALGSPQKPTQGVEHKSQAIPQVKPHAVEVIRPVDLLKPIASQAINTELADGIKTTQSTLDNAS